MCRTVYTCIFMCRLSRGRDNNIFFTWNDLKEMGKAESRVSSNGLGIGGAPTHQACLLCRLCVRWVRKRRCYHSAQSGAGPPRKESEPHLG